MSPEIPQDRERHALKIEWREQKSKRCEACGKINASRNFLRQIAKRFKGKDHLRSGRDRGR